MVNMRDAFHINFNISISHHRLYMAVGNTLLIIYAYNSKYIQSMRTLTVITNDNEKQCLFISHYIILYVIHFK